MKIISKYKDYYDYLNKFGIDEKIVLDRTKYEMPTIYPQLGNIVTIYFCDWKVEGVSLGKEKGIVYGKNILNYFKQREFKKKKRFFSNKDDKETYSIYVPDQCNYGKTNTIKKVLCVPIKLKSEESPNSYNNIPILLSGKGYVDWKKPQLDIERYYQYPVLSEFNFNQVFPPEEAYRLLYDWLIREKPMIEISNDDKIKGHGFDLKTSFRKM